MDSIKILCSKYKAELADANEDKLIAKTNVDILTENIKILKTEMETKDNELVEAKNEIERLKARVEELEVRFDVDPNEVVEVEVVTE